MVAARHRLLVRLALLLATTALAVLAAEWAVRALAPAYDPSGQPRLVRRGELVLGVPDTRTRQRKNTGDYDVEVRFGPRGFRDRRDVAVAGAEDLLVVGDSYAFGWGVEEDARWSNRLEAASGRRVFNVAIPGTDLDDYDRLLRHARALGSRAERLIVALCMENDLGGYSALDRRARAAGPVTLRGRLMELKSWLAGRSALYGLLTSAVHGSDSLASAAERVGLVEPNLGAVGRRPVPESAIVATVDRLAALVEGYRTTVLLVPSRALWLAPTATDADRVHRALVSRLASRGLEVVDPRAAFEATGDPLALHFAHDPHWTAEGHRIAAGCLAPLPTLR